MSPRDKFALVIGLMIGIILSAVVALPIIQLSQNNHVIAIGLSLLIGMILTYFTTIAAYSLKEEIRFYMPPEPVQEDPLPAEHFKLLDTNVIIDGTRRRRRPRRVFRGNALCSRLCLGRTTTHRRLFG